MYPIWVCSSPPNEYPLHSLVPIDNQHRLVVDVFHQMLPMDGAKKSKIVWKKLHQIFFLQYTARLSIA